MHSSCQASEAGRPAAFPFGLNKLAKRRSGTESERIQKRHLLVTLNNGRCLFFS